MRFELQQADSMTRVQGLTEPVVLFSTRSDLAKVPVASGCSRSSWRFHVFLRTLQCKGDGLRMNVWVWRSLLYFFQLADASLFLALTFMLPPPRVLPFWQQSQIILVSRIDIWTIQSQPANH